MEKMSFILGGDGSLHEFEGWTRFENSLEFKKLFLPCSVADKFRRIRKLSAYAFSPFPLDSDTPCYAVLALGSVNNVSPAIWLLFDSACCFDWLFLLSTDPGIVEARGSNFHEFSPVCLDLHDRMHNFNGSTCHIFLGSAVGIIRGSRDRLEWSHDVLPVDKNKIQRGESLSIPYKYPRGL